MNFEERLALFKEFFKAKPGSIKARKILQSLQQYQPTRTRESIVLNNPVIGIRSILGPNKPGGDYQIAFSGRHGLKLKAKGAALGSPQNLGERAVLNQLLNELPPKSRYNFEAIRELDEKPERNKRASAYRRYTRGAMNAYRTRTPWGEEAWYGYGRRIDQDRWQAKDSKGRYTKATKFNPVTADNLLNKLSQLSATTMRSIYRANPYVQGALTADDILKAYTGKGVIDYQKEQLGKTFKKQPDINLGPILPF